MLFLGTREAIDASEDGQRRLNDIFRNWKHPDDADFRRFYAFADSVDGCALMDVPDFQTLARTIAPFTPWLRFTSRPLVPIEEAVGISNEAFASCDSVS
jgi:hypothetical protein